MSVQRIKQLETLKEKRKALQEKEEAIKTELIGDLSTYLIEANALEVEFDVLMGGILEVIEKAKKDDKVTEAWKLSGQKFRQQKKGTVKKNIKLAQKVTENKNDGQ